MKEISIDHITAVIVFVFYRQITAGITLNLVCIFKFKCVRAMDDDLDTIVSLPDELHKDTGSIYVDEELASPEQEIEEDMLRAF